MTGGWEEKWRLKLPSAKVEVKVEAELGNIHSTLLILQFYSGRVTYLSWYWCSLLVLTGGWPGGWVALEEWKLRLTSAKVEVEVEAELGNRIFAKKTELNIFIFGRIISILSSKGKYIFLLENIFFVRKCQ